MQLKPLPNFRQPSYPDRRSKVAHKLALGATIAGATLFLGYGCGGSERHTQDPIAPPGEPPITQLEEDAEEVDEADEQEEEPQPEVSDEPIGPPGVPPVTRLEIPRDGRPYEQRHNQS